MSTQRRSFFALKCAPPDLAFCAAVPGRSLSGGDAFSLGATVFVPHNGSDKTVVEQPGSFRFGYDGGAVLFESKNLGRHRSDPAGVHLLENEWNRIDAVYDGEVLRLYIQGIPVYEANATGERFVDGETRWQMGDLDGYVQEVTLAARAFTDDEVRFNQIEHVVPDGELELCADFDAFDPRDAGRHALPLQLVGHCDVVNLVPALRTGTAGSVLAPRTTANPGAFSTGAFTVLAKVFPTVSPEMGDGYVFANGALGDAQGFALGVTEQQTRPFCLIGGERFAFGATLSVNEWSDLAVSVSGAQAAFFVDGAPTGTATLAAPFARTEPADVMIGNAPDAAGVAVVGFPGFIDAVTVFDRALDADRLAGYADVAPYRFDDGVAASWLFSDEAPREVVLDGQMLYAGGAAVALRENTVLDPNPPTLAFALPDVATGMTDVEEWESRAAATVLLETVKALTGQEAVSGFSGGQGKLNGSMAKALYVTLAADARMKSIEDEGSVTRDVLIGIFASVSGVAALWPVFEAFYLSGARWQNPYRIARFLRYVRILSPVAKSKVSKAIAAAAAIATVSLAARPSPDPRESKTKGATIALKSLAFYSDASKDCGAVCIRPDFDASPVLPEWTEGCTASQSAYWRVGADARPVLRLTLAVSALDAPTTVQVKATAQGDGLLGSLDEQNVTLAAVGDVTVDFPLAHHALGAADLGSHNVLFQWRAGDKLLGSTKHEVHVLAARPLPRWSNEPGKGELPTLPAIRMAEAVQAQESTEEEASRRFCGQFVAWVRAEAAAGKLVGRPWADGPAFVHWDKQHRNLLFDIASFFEAYAAPPVAVGALDLAGLTLALARMEGLAEVRLAELSGLAGTGGLMVRAAYRLGETAVERSLTAATYPVACVKDGSHDRIYDAYLEPVDASGARVSATGLPFSLGSEKTDAVAGVSASTYRTLLCAPGTTGCVALRTAVLGFGTLPLQGISPGEPVVVQTRGGRPSFDRCVIEALTLPPTEARCHSLSFVDIERLVVNAINLYVGGSPDPEVPADPAQLNSVMFDLWRAVTHNEEEGRSGLPVPQSEMQVASLARLTRVFEGEFPEKKEGWSQFGNDMVSLLNSEVENLRRGMSDWNSSIGSRFDPQDWCHLVEGDESLYCDCSMGDPELYEPCDTILDCPCMGPGFYLANPDDCQCLTRLRCGEPAVDVSSIVTCAQGVFVDLEYGPNLASDTRRRFLYSSTNSWGLNDIAHVYPAVNDPVYYLNVLADSPDWVEL